MILPVLQHLESLRIKLLYLSYLIVVLPPYIPKMLHRLYMRYLVVYLRRELYESFNVTWNIEYFGGIVT